MINTYDENGFIICQPNELEQKAGEVYLNLLAADDDPQKTFQHTLGALKLIAKTERENAKQPN